MKSDCMEQNKKVYDMFSNSSMNQYDQLHCSCVYKYLEIQDVSCSVATNKCTGMITHNSSSYLPGLSQWVK